jgi:NAD(P)-dependent dehydrogenase (short-subunit alcohol dehydrogenase family)
MSTQNPVVITTGANNGIGFHLTVSLLEEAYGVAGLDLSGEDLAALQQDAHPDHLLFCPCDVTDEAQVDAAVEEALTRTLALELARYGICVNLVHPPLTNTKSASPLGIPPQSMADPADVGRKLAKNILSIKPVITPNFQTTAYLFLARRYPGTVGKLFSRMAKREKNTYRR